MVSGHTYFQCISMIFLPFTLFLKSIFDGKSISQWEHHIPVITCDEGMWGHSTRIELFYFDDNFRRIAQWVLAFIGCRLREDIRPQGCQGDHFVRVMCPYHGYLDILWLYTWRCL